MSIKDKIIKEISDSQLELQYDINVKNNSGGESDIIELRIYNITIKASLLKKLLDIEGAYKVNNFASNNNLKITYKK